MTVIPLPLPYRTQERLRQRRVNDQIAKNQEEKEQKRISRMIRDKCSNPKGPA